jgi:ribokinase
MSTSPAVVVCGTVNVDTFVGVRQFPTAGETVIAEPLGSPGLGGKGANQAVAAARFLADGPAGVLLLATVGEDAPGDGALAALRDAGKGTGVVDVHVPGGTVRVTVTADGSELRGPSRLVFRSTVDTAALAG